MDEFFSRRRCVPGAQETLWRKDDERLDEVAFHLAAQNMEVLRGGREIADLDVVLGARLKKELDASAGMFRPLPFVAVGKQQHNSTGALPFRFRGDDKLIDDRLRAVNEIAELRLPKTKHFRKI